MSKHISLSGLKTLLEPLVHLINKKAECPDWDENDPSSPSYITNRPFYGNDITLFNSEVYVNSDYFAENVLDGVFFKEGEYYSVVWNGELYECIAYRNELDEICIGDPRFAEQMWGVSYDGNVGCDAPFFMYSYDRLGYQYHYDGVLGPEGTHTIEISQGYIKRLDKKYLPNLARVATSRSYNDLKDAPIVYTDVIRYDVSQNLNTSQKAQARANIDAIEIDDLATVASSGDYNDLKNKLCSRVDGYSEWRGLDFINSGETANPAKNLFERWDSSFSLHPDKYLRAWKIYKDDEVYLTTEYRKGKTFSGYSKYFWGNTSLYNPSWENTGEDWCIYVYGDSYPHTIGCYIKGKNIDYATLITSYTQDDAWFSGDVYVGSTSGTNKDEGSKKLATEDFVNTVHDAITFERIDEICGIEPIVAFAVNDEGDALIDAGWPDENGNIQL